MGSDLVEQDGSFARVEDHGSMSSFRERSVDDDETDEVGTNGDGWGDGRTELGEATVGDDGEGDVEGGFFGRSEGWVGGEVDVGGRSKGGLDSDDLAGDRVGDEGFDGS